MNPKEEKMHAFHVGDRIQVGDKVGRIYGADDGPPGGGLHPDGSLYYVRFDDGSDGGPFREEEMQKVKLEFQGKTLKERLEEKPKVIKMVPAPHRTTVRKKLRRRTKKVPNPKVPGGWGLEVIPGKFEETLEEVPGFRPEPTEEGLERMTAAEEKRERRREKAQLRMEVEKHRKLLAKYGPGIVSELIEDGFMRPMPVYMGVDLAKKETDGK